MDEGTLTIIKWFEPTKVRDVIRIDRADPRARITRELLESAVNTPWASVKDGVFTVADDFGNRYIYRIGEYRPLDATYAIEWPD